MMMIKQAAILALFGTAIAAPLAHHRHRNDYEGPYGRWETSFGYSPSKTSETVTVTTSVIVIPANGGNPYHQDGGSSVPVAVSPPTDSGYGSGSDSGSGSTTPTTGSGSQTGYMAVVSKWRSAGGLPALTQSSKLEANALKTVQDGHGQMQHELNPGTMGQVLAPGSADGFEKVYVGGWLCEDPSLPGLNGICNTMTAGWDHSSGEKGHAEILTNAGYKNIGCALADGIWGCDFS